MREVLVRPLALDSHHRPELLRDGCWSLGFLVVHYLSGAKFAPV